MEVLLREYQNYDLQESVNHLDEFWRTHSDADAIILPNGADQDGSGRTHTIAFYSWLFKCDVPNAVVVITKRAVLFIGSKEKANFLSKLVNKFDRAGMKFEVIIREKATGEEDMAKFVKAVGNAIGNKSRLTFYSFQSEEHQGKVTNEFKTQISQALRPDIKDGTDTLLKIVSKKRGDDLKIIGQCNTFLSGFFSEIIKHLEVVIDSEQHPSHVEIGNKAVEIFDGLKAKDNNLEGEFLELTFAPSFQSGGHYELKPISESNSDALAYDVIVINSGVKYFDLNAAAVRTLFVNATDYETSAYKSLYDAHELLISALRPGRQIRDAYAEALNLISSAGIVPKDALPSTFGHGIGIEFKEQNLVINSKNSTTIKEGMVFYVFLSAKDLDTSRGSRKFGIMIADIVKVEADKTSILTGEISKKFKSVSYSMELNSTSRSHKDDHSSRRDDRSRGRSQYGDANPDEEIPPSNVITRMKKKKGENGFHPPEKTINQKIQEHQAVLLRQKAQEMQNRLRRGDMHFDFGTKDHIKLVNIQAYRSREEVPKKQQGRKIEVDLRNDVVWVPIDKSMVPFSVAVIKNVSLQHEGSHTSLRINFNIPHLTNKMSIIFPQGLDFNPIYLKELNFRSADRNHLEGMKNFIKAMIADFAKSVELRNVADPSGGLILTHGKKPVMEDLKMWPPYSGKKTYGRLELHKNGFKFRSNKNEEVDILFNNIKNAIYQPSEGEEIILLHFNLKQPMIVGRKKTTDIQFFADVGMIAEDLYDVRDKRNRDFPEEEEDRLYEEHRANLDRAFGGFVESVERETNNQIKFDVPLRNIGFPGIYVSSTEMIYPTVNCLVSLTKNPFLVVSIDDIEVVIFERTGFMNKTFDAVFIFKDYSRTVQLINAIPAKMREVLKVWLDSVDIIVLEGRVKLQWDKIMKRLAQDMEGFVYNENAWISFSDNPEFKGDEDDSDESDRSEYDANNESQRDDGSETSESEETDRKDDPSQSGNFDVNSYSGARKVTASNTKQSQESS